jgi:putative endonuclease
MKERPSAIEERRERLARGRRAEDAAAAFVLRAGMTIVGRNVRVGRLEIDLLAIDGPAVVVFEVRTRGAGSWVGALDSVDGRKQRRLRAAGESLWRTRFKADRRLLRMRFDLLAVDLDGDEAAVEHVRAAF